MLGKVKNFALKKLIDSQMKGVPEDQKQMIMEMLDKDPKLFEKIAKEMQAELKLNGNNQTETCATSCVSSTHSIFPYFPPTS